MVCETLARRISVRGTHHFAHGAAAVAECRWSALAPAIAGFVRHNPQQGTRYKATSSVQGVVADPDGAMVPEATLTFTGNETSFTQPASTSADGVVSFGFLPGRNCSEVSGNAARGIVLARRPQASTGKPLSLRTLHESLRFLVHSRCNQLEFREEPAFPGVIRANCGDGCFPFVSESGAQVALSGHG